ncbi:efflux RND transporter periplasmic adaptor subunit [Azoarcus sp. KH32C]|uniref:efflux RND transporter periplasmic adaptor subunit n=1 Tax=Azoarcus sp. KH32C TaxID=748247 RepID=UPI000238610A|nr:efflux RND transporter periplasmic adaptor subunit [Azoarcus sp. KH32C]BAL23522.1 efflux transporter, RND family, MFP subunit [Azoarcus sp. KH32C]
MKRTHSDWFAILTSFAAATVLAGCDGQSATASKSGEPPAEATRPALTVQVVTPKPVAWEHTLTASGNIAAWQETVIGSEIGGLRIAEVKANVGDTVRKGQLLVVLADDVIQADLAQARAALQEARAMYAEAQANADRARRFKPTGMMSEQQVTQYLTMEQTARSRIDLAAARVKLAEVRVGQTRIAAPDDGLVSARAAAVGSVPQAGQELFRLILRSRLEWRAELTADDFADVRPGDIARLTIPGGTKITGKVRSVAPSVDAVTRNGIAYVDLPPSEAKAGVFAKGEIVPARSKQESRLSLPQSAVMLREGFSFVFRLGEDHRVAQVKVATGRRQQDRVEILSGIEAGDRIVESGGGFLNDGDLVEVAPATPPAAPEKS